MEWRGTGAGRRANLHTQRLAQLARMEVSTCRGTSGQPPVVLNSSQNVAPLWAESDRDDSWDFRGCLREPRARSQVLFPGAVRATLSRLCSTIFDGCGRRLDARKVEHGGPVQVLIPPLRVRDGHREHCAPRLGGVVIRRAACGPDECVIPLGPPAQPLDLLG